MTVKTTIETIGQEKIMDDISDDESVKGEMPAADDDKLAKLKAKLEAKKGQEMQKSEATTTAAAVKKERSINFGIVGSGHAGNKISALLYSRGYDAVAINTATQDLDLIKLPESNKLLITLTVGGSAKERSLGKMAAESHRDKIVDLVNKQLADSQVLVLCSSLGGGSGSGSCETLVEILSATGKPIVVIAVLPMDSDDAHSKNNSLQALSELSKFVKEKKIHNLIVVDNAKIESLYHNVSPVDFFNVANEAIIDPIDIFNKLSSMPSTVKPLDPTEFLKLLIDGEGLSVYGQLTVNNYEEDTAIAEAVINNLNSNLLSDGFDIKQSKYAGIIIVANENVWKKIPSSSVNYAMAMVGEQCGTPLAVYKGVYVVDSPEDTVKVYSWFSGLGLPQARVEQLKKETQSLNEAVKQKNEQRNLTLNLDTGKEQSVSKAQEIKDKIAAKSSMFGKFTTNVVDRRNK